MSVRLMLGALTLVAANAVFAQAAPAPSAGPTAAPAAPAGPIDRNKLSYAIGYEIGRDFQDKQMNVDLNTVVRAIQEGYAKKPPSISEDEMKGVLSAMRDKMMSEAKTKFDQLAVENKAKSDKFMAENKTKKGIITLPSGIQYRVIEDGAGKRATATSEVTVHYRGSLSSGLEFDSSFARGVPATFKVDSVIDGWRDVLPLMKVGDHWQIFLPAEKAYGTHTQGPIGPNEALVFDIKLIDVK